MDFSARAALNVGHHDFTGLVDVRDACAFGRPCAKKLCTRRLRDTLVFTCFEIADPDVHGARTIGGVCDGSPVRRPRGIKFEETVIRDALRLASNRHDPQIAERDKCDALPVGRDRRTDDPGDWPRSRRIEIAVVLLVTLSRERDRSGEFNVPHRVILERAPLDFSIRRVDEFVGRDPLRAEREDVFARRQRVSRKRQPALVVGEQVVENLFPIRRPRRRVRCSIDRLDHALHAVRIDGHDGTSIRTIRVIRDFFVIRRPGGHGLV